MRYNILKYNHIVMNNGCNTDTKVYSNGILYVNNQANQIVNSSLYTNHIKSRCPSTNNTNVGIKHSSYERYLNNKKSSFK